MGNALNAKTSGSLWIQPGGANNTRHLMDCHDVGEIPVPEGGIDLLRKFDPRSSGWKVIGQTETPPDKVSFSIDTLLFSVRDWLEKVRGPFNLYVLQRDCGQPDLMNYVRGFAISGARRAQRKYGSMVKREEDAASTFGVDIEAWTATPFYKVSVARQTSADTDAVNDVAANLAYRPAGDCGAELDLGESAMTAPDSAVAPAFAVSEITANGTTWGVVAASPFAAGKSIMSVARVDMGRSGVRWIVALDAPAAGQGQIAYSDNGGTAWTTVSIGGAAAGHGAKFGRALFTLDSNHIWLAGAVGYIYFSDDGGETWAAQESGTIHAGDYNGVHFVDESNGFAWGAAGVCAKTTDGGASWAATAVPVAAAMYTGWILDVNRLWVGGAAGALYYSTDGGVSWTQRTGWVGSGAGAVRGLSFAPGSDLFAFMAVNSAAPVGTILRTFDGGKEWEPLTTPTNAGLNGVLALDENTAYACGEIVGAATAVILKVTAP